MVWRKAMPFLLALGLVLAARADSHVRIVRLSLVTGGAEVQLPGQQNWTPAIFNAPVVEGEAIRTLASGRVEIQLENGSTLRLTPNSQLDLAKLSLSPAGEFETSARLISGTAFVSLREHDSPGFQLILPSGTEVLPNGAASFRVDATATTTLALYAGKARLQTGTSQVALSHGELATLTPAQPVSVTRDLPPPDSWTTWSQTRDQYYASALQAGVQPDSLTDYANWYAGAPQTVAMAGPFAGTGLAYLGGDACPWTITTGDYSGWCWNGGNGWYRPASAPVIGSSSLAPSDPAMPSLIAANGYGNVVGFGLGAGGGGGFGFMVSAPCFDMPMRGNGNFYGPVNLNMGGSACMDSLFPWFADAELFNDGYLPGNVVAPVTNTPGIPPGKARRLPPGQHYTPVLRPGQRLGPPPRMLRATSSARNDGFRGVNLPAGALRAEVRPGLSPRTGVLVSHTSFARAGFAGRPMLASPALGGGAPSQMMSPRLSTGTRASMPAMRSSAAPSMPARAGAGGSARTSH